MEFLKRVDCQLPKPAVPRLISGPVLIVAALLHGLIVPWATAQPLPVADRKFWTTDGPVNALVSSGDTLYLGGDFTYIGPRNGPAVGFDETNGQLLGSLPRIAGTVRVVIPDNLGGWFIGGAFTKVGDRAMNHVCHLNADLSLDTKWDAAIVGTAVSALALDGTRLYIGGQFTRVGGQTIAALAGVSAETGTVEWKTTISGTTVNALQLENGVLYIGGNFMTAGGSSRMNLAAIAVATVAATAWNPGADNAVLALKIAGSTVYVGGQFINAGTKPRSRLAALDATTGVAATWNPNPNGIVRAIAVGNNTVFVGGDFNSINATARRGFAALDPTSAAVLPLDLQLPAGATANLVRSVLVHGNSLYVGGQFSRVRGEELVMLAGVDLTTADTLPTPLAMEFNGAANAPFGVNGIAAANGRVLAAGDFVSMGGVARQNAAALSIQTGTPLPWAPTFDSSVLAMVKGPSGMYVAGSFTNVNTNVTARGVALLDPVTGTPIAFRFRATNGNAAVSIKSLALGDNILYVGGAFTGVTNVPRRFVAALDAASGALLPQFDAKLGGGNAGVSAMVLAGGNLYLAGDFLTVNGVSMTRLAAVSPATGAAVNWNPKPSPNQAIADLTASGENLYVSGQFATISGVTVRGLAIYRVSDNSLVPFDASVPMGSTVSSVGIAPNTLYVGGTFNTIGGENRRNLAALSSTTAAAYGWTPSPDVGPSVMAVTDEHLFIGGPFRIMPTGEANGFFAAFQRSPATQLTRTGSTLQISSTTGDRIDSVLQTSPSLSNPVWTSIATNSVGFAATNEVTLGAGSQFFRTIAR